MLLRLRRFLNRNVPIGIGMGWLVGVLVSPCDAQTVHSYSNTSAIVIADESAGVPYPSMIVVQGLTGVVAKVQVSLKSLTHSYPDDLDALLVNPSGTSVMLMSDAGGSFPLADVTIQFDVPGRLLPNSTQITAGTYAPSNWGGTIGDVFPPPAPSGPYSATLSDLEGTDPNGVWSLFLHDDVSENAGELENGWNLIITVGTQEPPPLAIRAGGKSAELFWPVGFKGFALESCPNLEVPPNWSVVTNRITTTNGEHRVTIALDGQQGFFRLRK